MRTIGALCFVASLFPLASYGQITPLIPHIPDSVYIKAEVLVEIRVYEEDTLYGFVPGVVGTSPEHAPRMAQWDDVPFGAIKYQRFSRHRQSSIVSHFPELPTFDVARAVISFLYLYQVKSSHILDAGHIVLRMGLSGLASSWSTQDEDKQYGWEYFLEHGQLIINADTLQLKDSANCGNLDEISRPDTTAPGWACWPRDDMLLHPNDIVQMSISSRPSPPPAPYAPTELTMWQHRASNGSTVPGAVWLSWRIPVNGAGPAEQLRMEREHGIHYEYKVLRDGDNEWETILLEDTKEGVVDEVEDPLFGLIAYQRRKYLVAGLDRNGEYSFCIRAVNAAGTSDQVCNLDVITPVSAEASELPTTASLAQNYPNPFNPSTEITYSLTQADHVRLSVFDMTGRIVSVPVDGVQAAGHHAVRFNAHRLPTGTYIYRLRAGYETLTRTMTLMR